MKSKRSALCLDDVVAATYNAKSVVKRVTEKVAQYNARADEEKRLAACECLACWYLRGPEIVCHSFSEWTCRSCLREAQHPNTSTPRLCHECAGKMKLCVKCMADLDLQPRRSLETA